MLFRPRFCVHFFSIAANNKKFGVTWGREVAFYEWNIVESTQKYSTLEEFYANASHNGALLKDIWPYVENAGYMVG